MDFKGKSVLVVGAARSGVSAARLLKSMGAVVTLADSKPREKLPYNELESLGVMLFLGRNADDELVKKQKFIIASPGIPPEMETFAAARRAGIQIIGELELAYAFCPCPVAAITGTNGKTTTTALAGEIIARHIKNTVVAGNIGAPFSESVLTLDANGYAVIEASSFQLEDITVFKPKVSAILNITPDHLDRHKTLDNYIKVKTNVYKYTDIGCTVVLNRDDAALRGLTVNTGAKVLYFSAETELSEGVCLKNGEILLCGDKLINAAELKIPGKHNVQNALAASLIAACAGVPREVIAEGLRAFRGVAHRLEFVREVNGVKYYNDSKATNPEATETALMALDGKTVLIAGGYDKGSDFSGLARLFDGKLSRLIALGDTSGKIIAACEAAGFTGYVKAKDYQQAVELAAEISVSGRNVLLSPACASWDMFVDFEERGNFFKDLVNNL